MNYSSKSQEFRVEPLAPGRLGAQLKENERQVLSQTNDISHLNLFLGTLATQMFFTNMTCDAFAFHRRFVSSQLASKPSAWQTMVVCHVRDAVNNEMVCNSRPCDRFPTHSTIVLHPLASVYYRLFR